mgnify:FL=1
MFAEQSKAESEEKKENSAFHQTGAQNKSRHYACQTESDTCEKEKCGQNSLIQHQVSAQNKSRHYAWWNPFYWLALGLIRFYRKFISPMK